MAFHRLASSCRPQILFLSSSFVDIYVDRPGQTHDAEGLTNSDIYTLAEHSQNGYLFPREKTRVVNEVEIPVHLIGGPAYPLKKWLMTGFTHHPQLTAEQRLFNCRLASARECAEQALGRLKGRWRCLAKRNDVAIGITSDIVAACCILHNVCELNNEAVLPEWNTQVDAKESLDMLDESEGQRSDGEASAIREAVTALLHV
ncbi:protein ALP1-like [Megalops cyprinoides]|uniref:protein ALP1-like n=1 Tax=Megalops cyprinoides TaxID=118141 RepID=UPI0018644C3B|nr:protein ALP1-like [Megalops cyprinoides]